jgi:hypothetical protein
MPVGFNLRYSSSPSLSSPFFFFLDYKKVEESLPYDYMGCQVAAEVKRKRSKKERTKKRRLYKV